MRRRSRLFRAAFSAIAGAGVIVGGSAVARATTATTGHPAAATTASTASAVVVGWGDAQAVTGPDRRYVGLNSVSCSGPGDCAAGGWYTDSQDKYQGFVMDEKNGSWGSAQPVPGLVALNKGEDADVFTVSCASPGNCAAAGNYSAGTDGYQTRPFVVDEKNGSWGTAAEVPGVEAINVDGNAEVSSLSCRSAGNCSVIGEYRDAEPRGEVFEANETDGVWGAAAELPGLAALTAGPASSATPSGLVSCTAPGDCTAAGDYFDALDARRAYAATETGGTWGAAATLPGTASATATDAAALSCASAGNCTAGGGWWPASGLAEQAFLVTETGGAWGAARTVSGIAELEKGSGTSAISSVSCGSAGNCAAVGTYWTSQPHAFVVTETDGSWGSAKPLSAPAPLSGPLSGRAYSVSCPSAGNCSVGGYYELLSTAGTMAFVADEKNGNWGAARPVAGLDAHGSADVAVNALSCATPSYCGAAGTDDLAANGAFVVDKAPLQATRSALRLSAARVTYGHEQSERLTVTVAPQRTGTPAGTVTVKAGKTTVCVITLKAGRGGCTLAPKKLRVGAYHLVAAYGGNLYYLGSASVQHSLTVAR
jgi:hypothetical protein